jgi:hypothetical protein
MPSTPHPYLQVVLDTARTFTFYSMDNRTDYQREFTAQDPRTRLSPSSLKSRLARLENELSLADSGSRLETALREVDRVLEESQIPLHPPTAPPTPE